MVTTKRTAYVSPAEVMAEVGCTPHTGPSVAGSVGIHVPGGAYLQFTCPYPGDPRVLRALDTVIGLYEDQTFPLRRRRSTRMLRIRRNSPRAKGRGTGCISRWGSRRSAPPCR